MKNDQCPRCNNLSVNDNDCKSCGLYYLSGRYIYSVDKYTVSVQDSETTISWNEIPKEEEIPEDEEEYYYWENEPDYYLEIIPGTHLTLDLDAIEKKIERIMLLKE